MSEPCYSETLDDGLNQACLYAFQMLIRTGYLTQSCQKSLISLPNLSQALKPRNSIIATDRSAWHSCSGSVPGAHASLACYTDHPDSPPRLHPHLGLAEWVSPLHLLQQYVA